MTTYTVSTEEYTTAHTLIGIANICDGLYRKDMVFPLERAQVDAVIAVLDDVRAVLPGWANDAEIADLLRHARFLVASIERLPTSDKKGLSDHE